MSPMINFNNDPMINKDLKTAANVSTPSVQHMKPMLATEEYMRERACPRPGDGLYLILADLLLALKRVDTSGVQTILDYGAGVAPYRSLFSDRGYRRADITADAEPEYLISGDGRCLRNPPSLIWFSLLRFLSMSLIQIHSCLNASVS
jgi:hypothetical protein